MHEGATASGDECTYAPQLCVANTAQQAVEHLARSLADTIDASRQAGRALVLGFATGASPRGLYSELVRLHRGEGLDFGHVHSFNLDEYCGLETASPHSFRSAMQRDLFDHVNLPERQVHFLCDASDARERARNCLAYEDAIARAGGIDVQLLGLGANGHIAFNEPGSSRDSRTREVELDAQTRRAAEPAFAPAPVPARALTMGVATILEARRIELLAFGQHKAVPVERALNQAIGPELPATFLRCHPAVAFHLDRAAASA